MLANPNDADKPIIAQIFKMWKTVQYVHDIIKANLLEVNSGLMSVGIIVPSKVSIVPLDNSMKMKSSNQDNIETIQLPKSSPRHSFNLLPATHEDVPKIGQPIERSGSANQDTTISRKPSVKSINGEPASPKKSVSTNTNYTNLKNNVIMNDTQVP